MQGFFVSSGYPIHSLLAKCFHLILTASMNKQQPLIIYEEEKRRHEGELTKLKKKQTLLGWLRLCIIIFAAIIGFYLFNYSLLWGWVAVISGISLFLAIVSIDIDNNKKIAHLKLLIQINQEEINSLDGIFENKYSGLDFLPLLHDYAYDLDVFGKSSLYQLINRGNTEQGRARLADNFLNALPVEQILERHEAIKELAPQYAWRQHLQAFSMQTPVTKLTQQRTEEWLSEDEKYFTGNKWKIIVWIYSFITIATAIAAAIGYLSSAIFLLLFVVYFFISGSLSKRAIPSHHYLDKIVKEIDTISQLILWIEEKKFSASLLSRLQTSVQINNEKAHMQIKELKNILSRFDLRERSPIIFIFANSFLLWDVWQMMSLNAWKRKNKQKLSLWYELIAEFEVLNSLSTAHFNYPEWTIPNFEKEHFTLEAQSLGHPLIHPAQRVSSDFCLKGKSKIALITGSNMAGKSTFLRSLGVNIILAQAGSPVCASLFMLSPNKLMSSMRIADNLAENTSTFYAELKKLKTIIEAVNRSEPVFILLDEILRGTNSLDKHTGSEALIRQMIKQKAVAVLATHDVELGKLENEFPHSINNYHFDVQVEGEELYFDYKLKHGVCTSLNASILMKKIGIEV
jgi:DNA mismatch repair ATPase MutS